MNQPGVLPPISVGVINYNGAAGGVLGTTLISILASDYPDLEVIVADDGSNDGSVAFVRERFPKVKAVTQPNRGPNAARNLALRHASRDIVFITDNDVELAPDTLRLLVGTMLAWPSAAVATPMVLDAVERDRIYSNGVGLHYVCFGIIPLRHQALPEGLDVTPRRSVCGSGGIMLVRKPVAESLGGFDEDFIFGYDDGEFTYRVSAAGHDVVQVPAARIYHLEKPLRDPRRLRYQTRGRLTLIAKTYAARTLALLAPALLVFELAQILFLIAKGAGMEWFRGARMVMERWPAIMEKRRAVMAAKRRPDNELLSGGEIYMFPGRVDSSIMMAAKRIMEAFLNAWWGLMKPFLTK